MMVRRTMSACGDVFNKAELGSGEEYWSRFRSGSQTPVPSPTESRRPHVAFAPLAAVARRRHWKESTVKARQKGNLNPAG